MEYEAIKLCEILAAQRNKALDESAQAQAVIARLTDELAKKDEEIQTLKVKKK